MHGYLKDKRLVIVDDEPKILDLLTLFFKDAGQVRSFTSSEAVLAESERLTETDLFILDYVLPNMNGWELMQKLRKICPKARFIAMTGHFTPEALDEFGHTGWDAVALKPFDLDMLKKNIISIFTANKTQDALTPAA